MKSSNAICCSITRLTLTKDPADDQLIDFPTSEGFIFALEPLALLAEHGPLYINSEDLVRNHR